ncbi:MAG: TetR family transcriptional regulator [Enhygromyxa sp.]
MVSPAPKPRPRTKADARPPAKRETGLRERKKAETHTRILQVAHGFFHERGFEATTIEDICAELPISKRTFFRYFPDKEALVFPNRDMRLDRFVDLLAAAPKSEQPYDTFRRVTRLFAAEYMDNREQLLAQQALISTSPSLLAREREIDHDWERAIADAFARRLPRSQASRRRADVLAGAMIGVVRATMRHWFGRGCVDNLDRLGQEALDSLERGFSVEGRKRG